MNRNELAFKCIIWSKGISYFGSAFSEFAIPLYLISIGAEPIGVAFSWIVLGLARYLTGFLLPYFKFIPSDRTGIAFLDFVQALAILLPAVLPDHMTQYGCYLAVFCIGVASTVQQGLYTSLNNHIAKDSEDPRQLKTRLNSALETGKYMGMLAGYLAAYFVSELVSYKAAFAVDAGTFVLAALIVRFIPYLGVSNKSFETPKRSYSLLFRPSIGLVTCAQILSSFSIFFFNATYIFHLKKTLVASNLEITFLYILQYVSYSIGAYLAGKPKPGTPVLSRAKNFFELFNGKRTVPVVGHSVFRLITAFCFLGFAFSQTAYGYILANTVYSFVVGWSVPYVLEFFQRSASEDEQRAMGTARAAIVSIGGAIAAGIAGSLYSVIGNAAVMMIAFVFSILGTIMLYVFAVSQYPTQRIRAEIES